MLTLSPEFAQLINSSNDMFSLLNRLFSPFLIASKAYFTAALPSAYASKQPFLPHEQ